MKKLSNGIIEITTAAYGGEIHSIRSVKTGTEYLWDGNPAGWKYHAPVLFPIVGKVAEGTYRVDGETYALPQHGLARVREFALAEESATKVSYRLTDSEETRKVYPYRFALTNSYELSENSVTVTYTVENTDNREIFFCLGSHPAFFCPLTEQEALTDYYFEFEQEEDASIRLLDKAGLMLPEEVPYLKGEKIIRLNAETFAKDALIFHKLRSRTVSIGNGARGSFLSVDFHEFSDLGLWAPTNGARFVCIEPWEGHADFAGFTGELSEKEGVLSLAPGGQLSRSFTVTIHEKA